MIPILKVIAASLKKFFTRTITAGDPYWDNVVLNMRMETSDPYWDKKVLGLHCDGTNGSTTFTDVKGKTVTANGNAQISTAQYPALTGKVSSAYFDGTGDYLSIPDSTDWAFGAGDFTLRAKIRLTAYATLNGGNYVACIISQHVASQHSFILYILGTSTSYTTISFDGYDSAPSNTTINATYNFSLNTWYDIECCRNGNLIYIFVDGILINSGGSSFSKTLIDSTTTLKIGSLEYDATYKYAFPGYISEVEIYKGVALHTTNFTPPTIPFPEPAPVDDTGKSTTVVGNSILQGTTKKYGTGAIYFDGTGDYLSVAHSGDLSLSNLDFTIEGWVYFNSVSGIQAILDPRGTTHDYACAYEIGLSGAGHTGKIQFAADTAAYNTNGSTWDVDLYSTTSAAINTWYHIAVTRSGSSWKLFINGVQEASTTSSITIGAAAPTVYVGSGVSGAGTIGNNLNGYVDDLRVTKGVARYTANFTPTYIESGPLAGDPYYNYTSLLLKMNGADTSTTFTDNSYSPKTVTANGNAQLKTANYRYGTASGYFDGTGDCITVPYTSDFDFGALDFTIEMWLYKLGNNANAQRLWNSNGDYYGNVDLSISASGDLASYATSNGTTWNAWSSPSIVAVTDNTWHHIALVRNGGNVYAFLDGIQYTLTTSLSTTALVNGTNGATSRSIGGQSAGTNRSLNGYIDDVRVTKGVARYTSNFTPPGSHIATQHPDTDPWWLNTVLALRMDGTSGSTTFTDLKGKTVTAVGNTSVSLAQSKFGQAAYFDGTGDYLSVPDTDDWYFGVGDFTIETWARFDAAAPNYQTIASQFVDANNWWFFRKELSSDNKLTCYFRVGGTVKANYIMTSSWSTFTADTWYHLALVRSGSTIYIFIDGVSQTLTATVAISTNDVGNIASPLYVGSDTTYPMQGYLDDLRVTKGIARYTANFTPSEKPLPTYVAGPSHDSYWQNVVLALPFGTNLSDARGKTVTAYGNAAGSTAQKKFGSSSCYFDGTGDYLDITYGTYFDMGTGDFTIEAWFYPSGSTDANGNAIITCGTSTTNRPFGIYQLDDTTISFWFQNTTPTYFSADYTAGSSFANRWTHVVGVKSGSSIMLFVDGVLCATTAVSGTAQSATALNIGRMGWNTAADCLGYIDDLRITKGTARYTAGFNLPISANILG